MGEAADALVPGRRPRGIANNVPDHIVEVSPPREVKEPPVEGPGRMQSVHVIPEYRVMRSASVIPIIANARPDIALEEIHQPLRSMVLRAGHHDFRGPPRAVLGVIVDKSIGRTSGE